MAVLMVAVVCSLGCGASQPSVSRPATVAAGEPLQFAFVDQAGRPVSSETTQRRATIAALVTTYDLASQLVLRRVNQAVGSYAPRINAFAVILEPPTYAVLAPAFADSLDLKFPVVMADQASLEGGGALGPIDYVPTLVVLDSGGRVVERLKGPVSSEQIKAALDRASGSSSSRKIPKH
jgi:hypothetical protein